jgi:tRNA threonylcarbamoyladenosine biosynthesis protein TsaB
LSELANTAYGPCLVLDLCLNACVAAAGGGQGVPALLAEVMSRGHQERIAPAVAEVMNRAGLTFADLRRVGVTVGPGSFTGLRVGLSFAKSLALALDIECVGVSSLEALAASAPADGLSLVVIPSKPGLYYTQAFVDGAAVMAPDVLDRTGIAARLAEFHTGGTVRLVGPAADALADLAPYAECRNLAHPDPEALLGLVKRQPSPAASPRPLYLRAPDARTIAERQAAAV